MCPWVGPHAPSSGRQLWGCPAGWSISHQRGFCSRESTVRPPHLCGWSGGAPLLGRRPPPGLCAGTPVISCFHCSSKHLPWSPMQPSLARSSGLGVPLLPLAWWVGWVSPGASNSGGVDRCVLSRRCPRCMCVCGVLAHVTPVHRCARSVLCACPVGGCVPPPPPPNFFFAPYLFCFVLAFFFEMEKGARAHCRHKHGQLLQRCNSVVSSGVRRRCFGGGRAPGVRLALLYVHGYWSGWVWLVASLLLVLTS